MNSSSPAEVKGEHIQNGSYHLPEFYNPIDTVAVAKEFIDKNRKELSQYVK